jgi:hypothetical protein
LPRRGLNDGRDHFGAAEFLDDGCSGFALHGPSYALFAQSVKCYASDNRTGRLEHSYAK